MMGEPEVLTSHSGCCVIPEASLRMKVTRAIAAPVRLAVGQLYSTSFFSAGGISQ